MASTERIMASTQRVTEGEGAEAVLSLSLYQWMDVWLEGMARSKALTALEKLNPVEDFDSHITFNEARHVYTLDGVELNGSVTGWVHKFFSEFNEYMIIGSITRSPKWRKDAKSKYYAVAQHLGVHKQIRNHATGWPQDDRYNTWAQKIRGQTSKLISAYWEVNRNKAAADGTRLHAYIEAYYNELECPFPASDLGRGYEYFHAFHRECVEGKLVPFRTELRVFDRALGLAGSIDMLYRRVGAPEDSKELVMYDWKRSKEIKMTSRQKGKEPVAHLGDCNYEHYSLQLNVYAYLIEQNTPYKIEEMWLAIFHPNQDTYERHRVRVLRAEVVEMCLLRLDEIEQAS